MAVHVQEGLYRQLQTCEGWRGQSPRISSAEGRAEYCTSPQRAAGAFVARYAGPVQGSSGHCCETLRGMRYPPPQNASASSYLKQNYCTLFYCPDLQLIDLSATRHCPLGPSCCFKHTCAYVCRRRSQQQRSGAKLCYGHAMNLYLSCARC